MAFLPPSFALWHDLADCVATMDFHASVDGPTASTWTYRYDENGDLRRATLKDSSGITNITLVFDYNSLGQLVQSRTNPKRGGGVSELVRYTYDLGECVLAETDTKGDGTLESATRTLWAGGERTGSTTDDHCDGTVDRWSVVWSDESAFRSEQRVEYVGAESDEEETYAYDALGRLIETATDRDADGLPERSVWRGYDAAGRILWKDADNDGDDIVDTHAVWAWWCPTGPASGTPAATGPVNPRPDRSP